MGDTAGTHGVVDIDLSDLSDDQLALLEMALRADAIPHEFVGAVLSAPQARAAQVEMHVADVRGVEVAPALPLARFKPFAPLYPVGTEGLTIAGRWKRLFGALIDALVLAVPVWFFERLDVGWLGPVLGAVYVITLTALRGQTVGKMAVGTRVVDESTAAVPSLRQSVLRWLPVGGFDMMLRLAATTGSAVWISIALAACIVPLVVLGPILFDPLRRGLHDRLAGTVVVNAVDQSRVFV